MPRKSLDPRLLAATAIMTAVVFVLTRVIQVPTPVVGYIHLGEVGIFFSALAFGPLVGAVAGGVGTALADLTSPYAQWAIYSLIVHGLEGWLVGWLSRRLPGTGGSIAAIVVGGLVVVAGYLLAGTILIGFGAALAEIPLNVVQVAIGGLVAIPLYAAVRRAYPPILRFGRDR
jgi:uncharacterized membrane protein